MKAIDDRSLSTSTDADIPARAGVDPNYLTRDLMSALERAAFAKVHRVARARGISLRETILQVTQELGE